MEALSLLSGDSRVFATEVWGCRVHRHRTEPAELVALLSLDDVDELVTSSALRVPALRVVQDGSVLPSNTFTRRATTAGEPVTGLVDSRKVLDLYGDGATLVLQGLQRYWPPLTGLVASLEQALGHPCQANAYLTPPGSQGFATHSDTHDVFVFQTHGTKLWTIDGEEVLLEPGLCVYLPTGTPHSARSQHDASLHVTIGINRITWRDALRRLTDQVLSDHRYDEPLPAGYLDEPDRLAAAMADQVAALVKGIDAVDQAEAVRGQRDTFLTGRPSALRGALVDRTALDSIADDTVMTRPSYAAMTLLPGEPLRVLLGDRELRVPGRLLAALEFVRDHETWSVAELPLPDAQSRVVLARRLAHEGLLRLAKG